MPIDYEVVIDGDQPSQGEALSAEEAFHIISEQMQTFNDLAVNRETEEFLKKVRGKSITMIREPLD